MLCWVLDGAAAARAGEAGLAAALRGGVDCLQLRDRELGGAALLALAGRACRTAHGAPHPVRVLVNRRLDVARAAGADGAHLGFDALPVEEARRQLGEAAWIGVSCHAPEEVTPESGATYAQLAPIFPPLSKPSGRPALGLAALSAAGGRGVPVWAQGGMEAANAGAAVAAGAAGVAVTGALSDAADYERAARALRAALDGAALA